MSSLNQAKKLQEEDTNNDTLDKIISLGRGLPLQFDDQIPIHYTIAKLAQEKPNNIAVISGMNKITYATLHTWGQQVAQLLTMNGIGPGNRVAILVDPSIGMVPAVLGILQCGAAYVPLDRNQPEQRIKIILEDAGATAILTDTKDLGLLSKFGLPVHEIGTTPMIDGHSSPLPCSVLSFPVNYEDPAYIIYTSGSTGVPKGVLVKHKHLSASTLARHMIYREMPVFLLVSPLVFDSSVAGIWGTLTSGGCLIVASNDEIRDPLKLLEIMDKEGVTHLLCIPSLYETLLDAAERNKTTSMHSMNTIIVAGEPLRQSLLQRHFAIHPKSIALVNEYGPTEVTVWATYRIFNDPSELVSIGGPIPGTVLYVLDDALKLVPPGEVGELYIGGPQVAEGYFGRPYETEQVFLKDNFINVPDARMYRTGDLVRWNKEGTLDFIGRKDQQIKLRGHRVELAAIETTIMDITSTREVVVVANAEQTHLTAFIAGPSAISTENIYEALQQKLPPIMIPSHIRMIEHLPRTISGKIDRTALSKAAEKINHDQMITAITNEGNAENSTHTTMHVTAAWKELLKLPYVPTDANFFDLGGHSLMVFKLQDALERHTGKRPSIVSLFRHTTVSTQAQLIYGEYAEDTNRNSRHTSFRQRRARPLNVGDLDSNQETIA